MAGDQLAHIITYMVGRIPGVPIKWNSTIDCFGRYKKQKIFDQKTSEIASKAPFQSCDKLPGGEGGMIWSQLFDKLQIADSLATGHKLNHDEIAIDSMLNIAPMRQIVNVKIPLNKHPQT